MSARWASSWSGSSSSMRRATSTPVALSPSVAGQLDRAVHDGEHVGPDRRAPPDQPLIEQRGARDLDAF